MSARRRCVPPARRLAAACALLTLFTSACTAGAQELIENRQGHRLTPEIVSPTAERVQRLRVPEGFSVAVWREGLGAPRMMAAGDGGTLYVTRPSSGDVLALRDANGDGQADEPRTVIEDLDDVHGIALHEGRMYLATVDAVYVVDRQGSGWGEPRRMLEGLPPGGRHPNRTLGFGPDGRLYVSVGSTCNACVEPNDESATILRVGPGGGREIFARGLRNTVGFDWHPTTRELWGMDNGTDWLGDSVPPEELNRLGQGADYGWPFLYGDGKTPEAIDYPRGFDVGRHRKSATGSVLEYTAHAAPIQMVFYEGGAFPAAFRDDAFVAMRGSWNRRPPSGYEIARVEFDAGRPVRIEPFVSGFLIDEGRAAFGRPAGIAVMPDGSLVFGDDANGVIYRVTAGASK